MWRRSTWRTSRGPLMHACSVWGGRTHHSSTCVECPGKDGRPLLKTFTLLNEVKYIKCQFGVWGLFCGMMAQWLRAFASLTDDPGSIPRTHTAAYNHLQLLQFQDSMHSAVLQSRLNTYSVHELTQSHKMKKSNFLRRKKECQISTASNNKRMTEVW